MLFNLNWKKLKTDFSSSFSKSKRLYLATGFGLLLIFSTILYFGPLDGLGNFGLIGLKRNSETKNYADSPDCVGFCETFDGAPTAPLAFNLMPQYAKFDVQLHERDHMNDVFDSMVADHGADCSAPPATHEEHMAETGIFNCKNHIMTAISGAGYGMIALTPNQMINFADGTATISWRMSTNRNSDRDWLEFYITPWANNITLPIQTGFDNVDLQGPPNNPYVGLLMFGAGTNTVSWELLVPNGSGGSTVYQTYSNWRSVLTPSKITRDLFTIEISKTHIKFYMPEKNFVIFDKDLTTPLTFGDGVVQFTQHSYNPVKGICLDNCYPSWQANHDYAVGDIVKPTSGTELRTYQVTVAGTSGATQPTWPTAIGSTVTSNGVTYQTIGYSATATTWHWDNITMSPTIPFTIIHTTPEFLGLNQRTGGTAKVSFDAPSPVGAYLRFSAVGAISLSYDNGTTWNLVSPNKTIRKVEDASGYFVPIPEGLTSVMVKVAPPSGYWGYALGARDFAVWSQQVIGGTPTPTEAPSATLAPSDTPTTAPTATPTDTPTPTPTVEPTATPTPNASPITLQQQTVSSPTWGSKTPNITFSQIPANNDIIILTYKNSQAAASATRTWPAGFTEFVTNNYTNNGVYVAWKRASGESSAKYTLNLATSGDSNQLLEGQVWRNAVTSGNPIDGISSVTNGFVTMGAETWSPVTTFSNNEVHVLVMATAGGTTQPAISGYTPLTFSSAHWLAMYYKTLGAAGNSGSPTGTFGGGNMYRAKFSYTIRP